MLEEIFARTMEPGTSYVGATYAQRTNAITSYSISNAIAAAMCSIRRTIASSYASDEQTTMDSHFCPTSDWSSDMRMTC